MQIQAAQVKAHVRRAHDAREGREGWDLMMMMMLDRTTPTDRPADRLTECKQMRARDISEHEIERGRKERERRGV